MGLFDKLFGKRQTADDTQSSTRETVRLQEGDKFISTGDNYGYKINRPLTEKQKERID